MAKEDEGELELGALLNTMKQAMLDRFGFWVNEPLLRLYDALSRFDEKHKPKVVFMPDIVRDGVIIVPTTEDISADLSPGSEKNRLRGYVLFLKGGGHAFIGAYAAAALREMEEVDVSIIANVFERDHRDLVEWYMGENLESIGARPINSSHISIEPGNRSSINLVVEQKGSTPIITGKQPSLDINELKEHERAKVINAMQEADVVAALSVKAPSFRQTIQLIIDGELKVNELFSDCTSGDNVEANYEVLDVMRMHDSKERSPITLLSINSDEARLYAALLRLEDKGKRQKLIEMAQTGNKKKAERIIERKIKRNGFQDAVFLNERLGIPLLYHAADGSCIIDKTDERSTRFLPSVKLRKLPDNFVGAGDTLCGGMALALAIKRRLDDPKERTSNKRRLSMEDCLIIANLVTCYRLERIAELSEQGHVEEWHRSVGSINQLLDWASDLEFSKVTSVPPSMVLKLGAVDMEGLVKGSLSDEYVGDRIQYMWEERINAFSIAGSRKKIREGIPFEELKENVIRFVTMHGYGPAARAGDYNSFLNRLRVASISEKEAEVLSNELLSRLRLASIVSDNQCELTGRIMRILGLPAIELLLSDIQSANSPELYKPHRLSDLIKIARKIGDLFNRQLEKMIKESEIALMLYPWKNEVLDNITTTAADVGDWETARALAKTVPTHLLWISPPDEAPSVAALHAIEDIARRTGDGDVEVAQILHEAIISQSSTHNTLNTFALGQLIGEYPDREFCKTAGSALEAIRENLAAAGISFVPKPLSHRVNPEIEYDKGETGWSFEDHMHLGVFTKSGDPDLDMSLDGFQLEQLTKRVLREKSFDVLHERDMRDLREKVAVLQQIQRSLITTNPKVEKALKKQKR